MISQGVKKIWNTVTTVLAVLLLVMVVLLVGIRLFGIKPYTVLSGSMEPTYPVGSLIYVKKVDPLTLMEKDPVTFLLNDRTVATHRIIEVIPDEEDPTVVRFRTKGDNNKEADNDPLHSKNVIGKPIFCIPYLGYVAHFVQVPPGKYIALGTCMLLLIMVMLPMIGKGDNKVKEEKPAKPESAGDDPPQKGDNPAEETSGESAERPPS